MGAAPRSSNTGASRTQASSSRRAELPFLGGIIDIDIEGELLAAGILATWHTTALGFRVGTTLTRFGAEFRSPKITLPLRIRPAGLLSRFQRGLEIQDPLLGDLVRANSPRVDAATAFLNSDPASGLLIELCAGLRADHLNRIESEPGLLWIRLSKVQNIDELSRMDLQVTAGLLAIALTQAST